MNPYSNLPSQQYWSSQISSAALADIDYDPAPKWQLDFIVDKFATSGSCFAQHFAREIRAAGGNYVETETRHPLIPETTGHGYGLFSARYGNIYTCRQLKELIQQATGRREMVCEFQQRDDGRWIDLLRLRAVPDGFSSEHECRLDRSYHLGRVHELLKQSSVFVFTLGLTEAWENTRIGVTYPICPGVIPGAFKSSEHKFINFSFAQSLADLTEACTLIHDVNPAIRILLTVSPVMLVASFEPRGALQSSVASKAILRSVADECVRQLDYVDYFPSFEIITGPQAQGRFYKPDLREVGDDGVKTVMSVFFRSRFSNYAAPRQPLLSARDISYKNPIEDVFETECDEILLGIRDPSARS